MTVDLSSSNPEPTNFLMGAIVNELDNISQMLSTSAPTSAFIGKDFFFKSSTIFRMTTFLIYGTN